MSITKEAGIAIGVAVGALLAGGVALLMGSGKSDAQSGGESTSAGVYVFKAGHRYRVTGHYAAPLPAVLPTTAKLQGLLDAQTAWAPAGSFKVVSITATDTKTLEIVFDIAKNAADFHALVEAIAVLVEATTATIDDLGPTPAGGVNPPSSGAWSRATSVKTSDRVRMSVASYDFTNIAAALGVPASAVGFGQVLQSPIWQGLLHAQGITVWGPNATNLPADWPTDDPSPAAEYHAEFLYGGAPLTISAIVPFPALVWVYTPPASSSQGGGAQGGGGPPFQPGGQGSQGGVSNLLTTVVPQFTQAKNSLADAGAALTIAIATALASQQSNVDPQARSVAAQWKGAATQRQTDTASLAAKTQQTIALLMAPNLANLPATIKGAALGLGLAVDAIDHGLTTDSAQAIAYANAGPSPAADVAKQWATANVAIQTKLRDASTIFRTLSA